MEKNIPLGRIAEGDDIVKVIIFHREGYHITACSAAEAVEALVQFHAGVVILVERTAGHAVPIHSQSIVFCCLAGCDEALDSFEVYKYGASLLFKIPATGNDLNHFVIT